MSAHVCLFVVPFRLWLSLSVTGVGLIWVLEEIRFKLGKWGRGGPAPGITEYQTISGGFCTYVSSANCGDTSLRFFLKSTPTCYFTGAVLETLKPFGLLLSRPVFNNPSLPAFSQSINSFLLEQNLAESVTTQAFFHQLHLDFTRETVAHSPSGHHQTIVASLEHTPNAN